MQINTVVKKTHSDLYIRLSSVPWGSKQRWQQGLVPNQGFSFPLPRCLIQVKGWILAMQNMPAWTRLKFNSILYKVWQPQNHANGIYLQYKPAAFNDLTETTTTARLLAGFRCKPQKHCRRIKMTHTVIFCRGVRSHAMEIVLLLKHNTILTT